MIQTSTSQDKGLKLQKGTHIWVNLITTSLFSRTLESWFSKGNHAQRALTQIGEILRFTQNYGLLNTNL